ncbi:hypothetical protein MY3957_008255 [Beauveria namnaoensis]
MPTTSTEEQIDRTQDVARNSLRERKNRRHPTTIDLAFSNIDQASAVVEEYLTTGSLHYTVCIEVLAAEIPQRVISRYKVSLGEEVEDFVAQVKTAVTSLQPSLDSHENIEQTTTTLSNIIETAIRTCGHRQNNHKAGKNPWWNKEPADALLDYRALWRTTESFSGQETQHARICFKRTVRRVQRDFWSVVIADITAPDDVYKVTRWLKPRQRISPPPIQVGEQIFSTNEDKARALGQAKLERRTAGDDIADPWSYPVATKTSTPFDHTISYEEARFGLLSTGNTSPGVDGITVNMLQELWPTIGHLVTDIYNACLQQGYCSSAWRTAEVVMIPKPNKRNLTDPSAWRPISLLSCLTRFEDAIAEAPELLCGTPQGSPLSPVLYLLATAALYELPGATQRYGYADDTAMLFIGDTLEETTA